MEGAGRVHKVFAQCGEIRSDTMQYPISFNVSSLKINGEQSLPNLDLTEAIPNHSLVAFVAQKMPSGKLEARDMSLLDAPTGDDAPKLSIDYGIVTKVNSAGGEISWLKYGSIRFIKESLILNTAQATQLPVNDLIEIGRTVRFKADITGHRSRWMAIAVAPLSDVVHGRGRVAQILDGYGWLESTEHGEIYFPYSSFQQPTDPDARLPTPQMLLNADVEYRICAALPGVRGKWRALNVRLAQ